MISSCPFKQDDLEPEESLGNDNSRKMKEEREERKKQKKNILKI